MGAAVAPPDPLVKEERNQLLRTRGIVGVQAPGEIFSPSPGFAIVLVLWSFVSVFDQTNHRNLVTPPTLGARTDYFRTNLPVLAPE